jgi:hypothetical protein
VVLAAARETLMLDEGQHLIDRPVLLVVGTDVKHLHTQPLVNRFEFHLLKVAGLPFGANLGDGLLKILLLNEVWNANHQQPVQFLGIKATHVFFFSTSPIQAFQVANFVILACKFPGHFDGER